MLGRGERERKRETEKGIESAEYSVGELHKLNRKKARESKKEEE